MSVDILSESNIQCCDYFHSSSFNLKKRITYTPANHMYIESLKQTYMYKNSRPINTGEQVLYTYTHIILI